MTLFDFIKSYFLNRPALVDETDFIFLDLALRSLFKNADQWSLIGIGITAISYLVLSPLVKFIFSAQKQSIANLVMLILGRILGVFFLLVITKVIYSHVPDSGPYIRQILKVQTIEQKVIDQCKPVETDIHTCDQKRTEMFQLFIPTGYDQNKYLNYKNMLKHINCARPNDPEALGLYEHCEKVQSAVNIQNIQTQSVNSLSRLLSFLFVFYFLFFLSRPIRKQLDQIFSADQKNKPHRRKNKK